MENQEININTRRSALLNKISATITSLSTEIKIYGRYKFIADQIFEKSTIILLSVGSPFLFMLLMARLSDLTLTILNTIMITIFILNVFLRLAYYF